MTLSFVTVTFWRDFDLLERLLSTMGQFIKDSYIHYIILNDRDEYLPELEKIIDCHTHHQYKIILLSQLSKQYPTLVNSKVHLGWWTQQVLKLAISKEIKTEFYCILDSKDFVISLLNPIRDLVIDNKPIALFENAHNILPSSEFYTYRQCSYQVFKLEDTTDYCMRSHTPFIMKTAHVIDMLEYLSSGPKTLTQLIEGEGNPEILHGGRCVEFYLYMAWLRLNNLLMQYSWIDDFYKITFSNDLRRNQ